MESVVNNLKGVSNSQFVTERSTQGTQIARKVDKVAIAFFLAGLVLSSVALTFPPVAGTLIVTGLGIAVGSLMTYCINSIAYVEEEREVMEMLMHASAIAK